MYGSIKYTQYARYRWRSAVARNIHTGFYCICFFVHSILLVVFFTQEIVTVFLPLVHWQTSRLRQRLNELVQSIRLGESDIGYFVIVWKLVEPSISYDRAVWHFSINCQWAAQWIQFAGRYGTIECLIRYEDFVLFNLLSPSVCGSHARTPIKIGKLEANVVDLATSFFFALPYSLTRSRKRDDKEDIDYYIHITCKPKRF